MQSGLFCGRQENTYSRVHRSHPPGGSARSPGVFPISTQIQVSWAQFVVPNIAIATSVTVVSSLNPSDAGSAVTFTATITPVSLSSYPAMTGTVAFYDATMSLGTATVS